MGLLFEYKLLDSSGTITSGNLEAATRGEALQQLRSQGTILDLAQREDKSKDDWRFPTLEFRSIRPQQLSFLFRQMAELLDAGMPLVSAIGSLQKFSGNQKTSQMLEDVNRRLRSGESFSDSLTHQTGVFSHIQLAMVKVGERSGDLAPVLHRISDLIDTQLELRAKVRSALFYPFFVLFFSSLLCWGLVTFLLPQFEPIWTGAKVDLSNYPVTEFLLAVSRMSRSFWDELLLFAFLGFISFVFAGVSRTDEGRTMISDLLLKLPVLGNYLRLSATAETSSTIAMLLEAGMPVTETLDLASETASNPIIGEGLKRASLSVRQGNALSSSLDDTACFPELFIQMVSVGESSADLPGLLNRVSSYYRRQLDDSLKTLTSLIEPFTMVIIGGVVFVFVLGVFMPIMGIVSALSSQG